MDFIVPTPEQGHLGLRAMKTVATADGAIDPAELATLHAAMELSGAICEVEAIEPIEPGALAEGLTDPALRRQLLGALVLVSMADRGADPREVACIDAFARAFEVDHHHGRHAAQAVPGADHAGAPRRRPALLGPGSDGGAHPRAGPDRPVGHHCRRSVARTKIRRCPPATARWASSPSGTLGREYHDSLVANEFTFPGEKGSGPEFIAFHDMTHVLGDYGTSPAEEVLIGFFSAGFRRENPMTFALLVMLQLHLGYVTVPGQPNHEGFFEPRGAVAALRRGSAVTVDLSGDWEYWPVIDRPVAELRQEYGIAPRVR